MCLEQVYLGAVIREKLRSGPLGWLIEEFCGWMLGRGAARRIVQEHVSRVVLLSRGCKSQGAALKQGNARELLSVLEGRANRATSKRQRRRARSTVHRFGQYLESKGLCVSEPEEPAVYAPVLTGYQCWLREIRRNSNRTVELRRRYVSPFLEFLGDQATFNGLASVAVEQVREYAVTSTAKCGKSIRRTIVATLRTFLEFCYLSGHMPRDLSHAVPSVRTYRLSDTPRSLSDEQARMVLQHVDRSSPAGKRDYAVLQLLYTYGVRGGQVRALRIEDIDWRNDRILFRPLKRGKRSLLPLTDGVGEAVLDYLRHGRPQVPFPEVFMTALAPFHPLCSSAVLSQVAGRWIKHAGIEAESNGTHAFRHCFGGRMVNRGHSLKAIADILGHKLLATTFIYTKVDFRNLEQVALEWPEVVE
jgi:site-specific recombinase XerD